MFAMRTVHGIAGGLTMAALALLVAAGSACQSSSPRSNLGEYEKLVARRRALSATPMSVRAQQEAAAKKADEEAAAQAAAAQAAAEKAAKKKAAQEKAAAEKAAQEKAAAQAAAAEAAAALARQQAAAAEAAAKEAAAAQAAAELPPVQVVPPPPPPAAEPAAVPPAEVPPALSEVPPPDAAATGRPTAAGMAAYVLNIGDAVQIYLRGIPQPELVEDIIDEGGMVSLPLINEIRAVGLTASALEQEIRNTYLGQKIYRNITVQVIVPTRFYYVSGATRAPGRFTMQSAVHVSEAIAAAGGGNDFWSGRVYIRRKGEIFKDIRNAQKLERSPEDDILLEPGDIVDLRERMW